MNKYKAIDRYMLITIMMIMAWTQNAFSQTATGTSVTLSGETGKLLLSEGAGSGGTYSAFWKHKEAPIQLVMTNCAKGEVQEFNGTANVFHGINSETGIFTTLPNNMTVESDNKLAIYNWATHYKCSYFAIIAPKGFRILRYIIDADVTGNSKTDDVDFREFHLLDHETVIDDDVYAFKTTASGSSTVIDRVLDYSSSRLYFKVAFADSTAHSFKFTSFKVVYAVDDAFSASVPNLVDGVATNQFGSGIINLGKFSANSNSVWSFTSSNVNALSEVEVYNLEGKTDLGFAQVDGSPYYFTATNGDYMLEAPKQFRIVGAKVNFINVSTGGTFDGYNVGDPATPESGKQYLITDTDGKYISYINGALTSTDDARTAWTVTADGNGYTISIGGDSGSGSSVETGSINVTKNTGTLTANGSSSYYYLWTGTEKAFTITESNTKNNINSTNTDGDLNFHAGSGTSTYTIAAPEGYVITGYSFDASRTSTGTVTVSDGTNSLTVSTTSQAFSVSGLETSTTSFTVAGTNIPILFDNFKIDYKTEGSGSSSQTTTVTCEETTSRAATLFDNPEETSSSTNHYRIPAITLTKDNNLLAISDLRIGGSGDVGSNAISLVAKKSADNGTTWGTESTIIAGNVNGTGFDYAHGDAAIVTDSETGKIILLAASGTTGYSK